MDVAAPFLTKPVADSIFQTVSTFPTEVLIDGHHVMMDAASASRISERDSAFLNPAAPTTLFFYIIFCSISGMFSAKSVIPSSIEIFSTHEWLSPQPVIYFQCQGEIKIILPDVKVKNFVYKFKGIESWQPLAGLPDKKCKRCGLYELDRLKSDDVFNEWRLCPEGNFVHIHVC